MRARKIGRLPIAAVMLASAVFAIDPNRAMSQYIHQRWGVEHGFPRGSVYAITQTADGYVWIGTQAGLVRFDGWNFRLMSDAPGMVNVLGLTQDAAGTFWVRVQNLGLARYRNGVFEALLSGQPSLNVSAMSRRRSGDLLAAASEQGTYTYRNGKLERIADGYAMPRSPVISIAEARDGSIWAGTRDAGLFRIVDGKTVAVTEGLPDPKVNSVLADSDGGLWVGTDNGVVRWNGNKLEPVDIGKARHRLQALALLNDRDRNLWVGTDSRGLLRVNKRGTFAMPDLSAGQVEAVTAIFEDREGNLWVGSANGLDRFRDSAFMTYSQEEGAPAGDSAIFLDAENRLWLGPKDGGLWWLQDGKSGRLDIAGLNRDVVYSIAGSAGELWLARQRGGLTRLRVRGGAFAARTYTRADGLAQDSVYSVLQSRDGAVWAGTLSGGVSRLQNGKFATYTISDGLASNTVASILESADGTMWFATPAGLSALSGGKWSRYAIKDGLPSLNVTCLMEDSGGVLWAGTATGLVFRQAGEFRAPAGVPAPLQEEVLGIAEDRHHSLWIATAQHVLRVNREKLLQGKLEDGDFREFSMADGLRGVEGVKRHRSVIADADGRIWFSTNRGVSMVDPGRLAASSVLAKVQVQGISADGSTVPMGDRVRIPPGRRRVTFSFAGLSFSVPERVQFRYWLDGFDRGWSRPVSAREAVYTNLAPGPYRFRVIATNADGVWNTDEATVSFEIEPLFWQTSWFRAAVVLTTAFAILALYRFRLRQATEKMNVRFEERLAERTRIARELHDTLLQGFLSASMQLHVAADRLPEGSPARPGLNRVLELMGQVIEEGRNAVRGLRSPGSGTRDLEQTFSGIGQELNTHEDVTFRVIVEGQAQELHPLLRDEVYRIGREAMVNAFRHSRSKEIEVHLEYTAKRFRLLVRDTGVGIDPTVVHSGREGHWGLPGMRERADRIGGRLHVWSRASAGTEVELSVPAHIAFRDATVQASGWRSKFHLRRIAGQSPATKNGEEK